MNSGLPGVKSLARDTLANQMATDIMERILSGAMQPGDVLPSEPLLATQYGVSRSVVRDANRLLAARGLVEIRRGRGVFVTDSQREAFSDALLLALRREGSTVWDVEEFEQIVLPAAVSIAAEQASDAEIDSIRRTINDYIEQRKHGLPNQAGAENVDGLSTEMSLSATSFGDILRQVYEATHNAVLYQFAGLAVTLRSWRKWVELSIEEDLELDIRFCDTVLKALETRDRKAAAVQMARLGTLHPTAVEIMRNTPIGDIPQIKTRPGKQAS